MYILQGSLFSFEELMDLEPKQKYPALFAALDLTPFVKELRKSSPLGRKGRDTESMLRALLAGLCEEIPTFTKLVSRLKSDLRFRYYCGFGIDEEPPSVSTFSRFFQRLTNQRLPERIFRYLVDVCRREGLIVGEKVAIDSSEIDAYEKAVPKSKTIQDDQHPTWGSKLDSHGNQVTWFGYKLHLAVDADTGLPLALEVTPAHVHDSQMAIPLMLQVLEQVKEAWAKPKYYLMDAGYDIQDIYRFALEHQAQAIIPLNLRRAKEPPEGITFQGTPICSAGFSMTYWGSDTRTKTLKFRCPHATGHVDCPFGMSWCSSSNYGMVVKKCVSEDPRRFVLPHRGSRLWQQLYHQRTAVERTFSLLKERLGANDLTVRGIKKVVTAQYLSCTAILLSRLAAHFLNKAEKGQAA